MSRAIFLTLYIPVALFLSSGFASMWTLTIMALTLAQKGAAALFSPVFLISIFAPIALIVLAYARGKKINNRKLIWFPITAFLLTLVPLIMGLLVKALTGSDGPGRHRKRVCINDRGDDFNCRSFDSAYGLLRVGRQKRFTGQA